MNIKDSIQESLDESGDDYKLKTDDELVNIICEFGCGETEFHTVDIERLIREKRVLEVKIEGLTEYIEQLQDSIKNFLGVLDTPIGRRQMKGEFVQEVIRIAKKTLPKE